MFIWSLFIFVKRTKSPCLALDIGVKFGEYLAFKMEKKWRVLSTLPLENMESA